MHTDNRAELQELIGSDYQLQWIIGHGGMSTVWLADDPANDREVAIKVLRPEFAGTEEFLTRFRNEAHAAQGINSANVVATYDYREIPTREGFNVCFIVMEYVRGESLADLIAREGKLEESVALDVLEQAAHGLAVIHQLGLVHRDIKPGNLMITQNGKVKITDFGIAKAAAAVPLTRTGMVVGTAQYVSPEQAQGLEVTSASDVYSLAVVGYELLTGQRPFTGDSSVSVALAHVSNEVPPMSTSISAPTRELIGIALRKDPNTRFADGTEFQHAIADARAGNRPITTTTKKVAVEPSPQESTAQLAAVTEATTMHPEAPLVDSPPAPRPRPQQPAPRQNRQAQQSEQTQKTKKGGGFATGVLVALLVVLAGVAAVWAYTSGLFDGITGNDSTSSTTAATTSSAPETKSEPPTETVTETETAKQSSKTHERPTQAPPSTLYNSPEPERPSEREPKPSQQQPTRQPQQPSAQPSNKPSATQSQPTANDNPIPDLDIPGLPNP
ncbi:serine/threonine protein kinase [Corynebacterium sp. p3-SID1145]|uniref:serine/threonine-protein kinase n=1 Tax=unclassified Corynebacterium TaxID=2624378 RepID=UPI0021AA1A17|nr:MULTISPECIES: serine/threonine-protein kinase [unclassified Corynebacterium]MCT1451745.1 serine/threonine protein kinase [Corynebacterium sp. p3-SID1145]MCT1460842.1 serine/threonine protein kinase [Corynebacterium sp. p3-SID1140]